MSANATVPAPKAQSAWAKAIQAQRDRRGAVPRYPLPKLNLQDAPEPVVETPRS
jgi:hypothetical protein